MAEKNIGALLVMEDAKVVGIITERASSVTSCEQEDHRELTAEPTDQQLQSF